MTRFSSKTHTLVLLGLVALASAAMDPHDLAQRMGLGFGTSWFKTSYYDPDAYSEKFVIDAKERGLSNMRIRVRADLYGYRTNTFDKEALNDMLDDLEVVVSDCINHGVVPIISWIHRAAEANASEDDGDHFVRWWRFVARRFADAPFELAFNLFTELDDGPIRDDPAIYNDWTSRAIAAIRGTGGNNKKRVIILASPGKTAKNLNLIDPAIFLEDRYLMAEWHIYASGPNKNNGKKHWEGTGSEDERAAARRHINMAIEWSRISGIPTYMGAWMPMDNQKGSLEQDEVEAFAKFFATELAQAGIPSSINVNSHYYHEKKGYWRRRKKIGGRFLSVRHILTKALAGYRDFATPETTTIPYDDETTTAAHNDETTTAGYNDETTTAGHSECPEYRDCNCPDYAYEVYTYDNNGCRLDCSCKRA
eukprot:m.61376 g.61376  ORF g.61376 m.61376 type:complete len:422 (-) comp7335_c1_seq1:80-1345(-)